MFQGNDKGPRKRGMPVAKMATEYVCLIYIKEKACPFL
jgi:hypothetical protein